MKAIPILLFGAGGVGRALLQQIIDSREQVAARYGCRFQVVAVLDSRSWRWDAAGLADDDLRTLISAKKRGESLGDERPSSPDVLAEGESAGLAPGIVVDATASGDVGPLLERSLALGYGVVLANKKPLAAPWAQAQRYYEHPRVRFESTVGGGLPLVSTLRMLLDTGDSIVRIEGQLSGSLSYICRRLDEGTRFSVALAAAKARGYTEPDPRQDLSGRDVARKIVILGRMAGWSLEEGDVVVESLVPGALTHLDPQEFMVASMAIDPSIRDRVNAAGASGEVLRYVARVEKGGGQVGLKAMPVDSPYANLKSVRIWSERFQEPLLVGSNTSGPETTASGMLGDMVDLARAWGADSS
jgi:homoserine dehydrogenase